MNNTSRKFNKKKIIIAGISVILSIALYIFGYFYFIYLPEGEAEVHFIDVGQGDAALVLSNRGTVLIDTGTMDSGEKVAAYVSLYTDTIDYMILSHPHEDHIGGAPYVFKELSVKNVIMPDFSADSTCFDKLLDSIEKEKCNLYPAESGDVYSVGDIRIEILAPVTGVEYEDANNVSTVAKIVFGQTSFLFTGDIESSSENELLTCDAYLKSDVLKAPHHGSSTSSSHAFLEAVSPDYAVISCEKGNTYGHPHRKTLAKYKDYGISVLRTDKSGTVIFNTDGLNVTVQ